MLFDIIYVEVVLARFSQHASRGLAGYTCVDLRNRVWCSVHVCSLPRKQSRQQMALSFLLSGACQGHGWVKRCSSRRKPVPCPRWRREADHVFSRARDERFARGGCLRGWRNTVGNRIEIVWPKQTYSGPKFTGTCVKHGGVRFHRIRDLQQCDFNSVPPTSHCWAPRSCDYYEAILFNHSLCVLLLWLSLLLLLLSLLSALCGAGAGRLSGTPILCRRTSFPEGLQTCDR